jgi:hypothetical protein
MFFFSTTISGKKEARWWRRVGTQHAQKEKKTAASYS